MRIDFFGRIWGTSLEPTISGSGSVFGFKSPFLGVWTLVDAQSASPSWPSRPTLSVDSLVVRHIPDKNLLRFTAVRFRLNGHTRGEVGTVTNLLR
jgi:hypothetical protein